MNFSASKTKLLGVSKEKHLSTFLLALLTAAAFFVPFMVADNGYFFFYGDFNVQQVPFYQHCHELVRNGTLGWDFGTDLGVNFIGSYTFYLLGSPFFWLTLIFPNSFVPYLMGPLLILKFATSALTGYMYIRRFTKTPEAARLGGLLYAFSGFSVYNIFFNHFHEAIVFFPLLLLSLELLITENKRGFFAAMVATTAITNYFFFYGMVVFVVIYYFVRLFSGAYKFKVSKFLWLIFEAVLGLLLSAIIMLPTMAAVFGNSRLSEVLVGWGAIMYGKEQIYLNVLQCFFFPPDIPARPVFFPGAEVQWSSLGGWFPLFSVVGVWAFITQKKGNWLRRLIGILIFMALVPILNSAFYMFNTAYYARWYYMPVLMMALATVFAIENSKIEWKSAYNWVLGITISVSLVIGLFPRELDSDGSIKSFGLYTNDSDFYIYRFLATAIIAIVSLIVLGILLKLLKRDKMQFMKSATAIVLVLSVIYSAYFIGTGKSHSYEVKDVMIDALTEKELSLPGDKDTYRIDVYDSVDNTAMYLGYSSINAFHSIVPVSVTDFWEYVGEERGVASRPTTNALGARTLLGVKFLLERNGGTSFTSDLGEPLIEGFEFYSSEEHYKIYENTNYAPFGFTYDFYTTKEQADTLEESDRSHLMCKAILLNDEQIKKYGYFLKNIEESNDSFGTPIGSVVNFNFDGEELKGDAARLRANGISLFERTKSGFTAEITTETDQLVFFSVPFEEGWRATVNGKETEIEQVNVGFMAVFVPKGTNSITFDFETPGLKIGTQISALSLLVLLIYIAVFFALKRKGGEKAIVYPEGDELLEQWKGEVANERFKEATEGFLEQENSQNPTSLELSDEEMYGESADFNRGFWINTDIEEEKEE